MGDLSVMVALVCATVLLIHDKWGWGWFLIGAILISIGVHVD